MASNVQEMQYLNTLREIVVENSRKEYKEIVDAYKHKELSVSAAYDAMMWLGGDELANVLREPTANRTGMDAYEIFGHQMKFDMADGFPLLTTKKMFTRGIFEELSWFLKGETNIKSLVQKDVNIWTSDAFKAYLKKNGLLDEIPQHTEKWDEKMQWFIEMIKTDDEFAKKWGEMGPIYGAQWRNYGGHDKFKLTIENLCNENEDFRSEFNELVSKYSLPWNGAFGVDQIKNAINTLKTNPQDRRNLVYAFNPQEVNQQVLPACHTDFQLNVKDGKLNLLVHIRSNDMFLGAPFNMPSYAALLHMLAQVSGFQPGTLTYQIGSCHFYSNHIEQTQTQLSREPYAAPTLELNPAITDIENFTINDIKIKGYKSHPKIQGDVSV